MATVDNITATQAQQYSRLNGYIANVQDDAAANEQSSNQLRQLIAQLNLTIGDSIASETTKRSCRELWEAGARKDGTYLINPDSTASVKAYCDMRNGGWTLVGMIHTSSTKNVNEPNTFFADGFGKSAKELYRYAPLPRARRPVAFACGARTYPCYSPCASCEGVSATMLSHCPSLCVCASVQHAASLRLSRVHASSVCATFSYLPFFLALAHPL